MAKASNRVEGQQVLSAEKEERRNFLKTATRFAAVITAVGLTGEHWATIVRAAQVKARRSVLVTKTVRVTPQQQALGKLILEAIKTRNMKAAISKHRSRAKLTRAQERALSSLGTKDLQALNSIQVKLGDLAVAAGDGGNTGYVIY